MVVLIPRSASYPGIRRLTATLSLWAAVCLAPAAYAQTPSPSVSTTIPQHTGQPPPAAPTSTVPGKKPPEKAACQRRVDVLSGQNKDRKAFDDPELKSLAQQSVDLTICGAIGADSDKPCTLLESSTGGSRADYCRETYAVFHELRTHPEGRSFMFDERKFAECQRIAPVPLCKVVRDALRAGDPKKCVFNDFMALCRADSRADESKCTEASRDWEKQGKQLWESTCRAYAGMDKSLCPPGDSDARSMAEECKNDIEKHAAFAKGLKSLEEAGTPQERQYAKAARGETDACKPLARSAMDLCMKGGIPSGSGAAPSKTPGAETPPGEGSPPPAPTGQP